MNRNNFKVGDKVYFGRPNGQQTLGVIEKLNLAKAKVKTLEARGQRVTAGEVWGVPYSLMRHATVAGTPVPVLKYDPLDPNNSLLEALASAYCGLSPENLHCDGEASPTYVRQRRAELERKIRGLQMVIGRTLGEGEMLQWELAKREHERQTAKKEA